ncbi:AMP-binding protein [Rhodococcus sp. G-MC3]|uniref:AMP-binding protein n=1 Tax=Rhodococcus sp. G-MC3 TaxID=3046209 RepID=UPI0024BB467B|nr:AMP-binding protein [Rhodococcus sp. G-MC3]MDJ0392454.1 AMP-binding protein [Rhodococcus sp. G-MC3]
MARDVSSRGSRRQWLQAAAAAARSGALTPPPAALARMGAALWRHGATPATLLALSAARYPDRTAVIDDDGAITFAELYEATLSLAAELGAAATPVRSVGVLCRNHRGFLIGFLASGMIGSETVSINTELTPAQLASLLERHAPDVLVYDSEYAEAIHASAFAGLLIVADLDPDPRSGHSLAAILTRRATPTRLARRPGRITLLTSGTTGLAKGVPRSIRPMSIVRLAATGAARADLRAGDVALIGPPFFHGFGLLAVLGSIALGITTVTHCRFDVDTVLDDLIRHRVTVLFAVPVMLQRIVASSTVASVAPNAHLRTAATGAAPITGVTVSGFQRLFGDILVNGYGSTEAGVVSIATSDDLLRFPTTAGRAALGVSIRIVNERGSLAATGEPGRILVRGPLGYSGYTPDPRTPTPPKDVIDGYVDTGDVGYVDESGLLFLSGRSDDMIVSGGENVFPLEVEHALADHPTVADVAVIGVDDPEFGQVLRAFVVPAEHAIVDHDALTTYLRGVVERYKVPKRFVALTAIPRNPSGKVLRHKLIDHTSSKDVSR